MKNKKIISTCIIALTIVCSTSITASAATKPSDEVIASQILEKVLAGGKVLNYDGNLNTQMMNIAKTGSELELVGKYQNLKALFNGINSGKTIKQNLIEIYKNNQGKRQALSDEIKTLASELKKIENSSDNTEKLAIQKDIENVIKASAPSLNVYFGKNTDGKSTVSIVNRSTDKIIIQINSGNAYTMSNLLKDDNFINTLKNKVIDNFFN